MTKVLITTAPFCSRDRRPLDLLERAGLEYQLNPHGTRLSEAQLAELVSDVDIMIAGTEPITERVMSLAPRLRFISRVGIGLDSVDLVAARARGIKVSYTPEAPAPAVAELAVGMMFALLRSLHVANAQMHRGQWQRVFGRRLSEVTIGVIGAGRIGGRVLRHVSAFKPPRILVNDVITPAGLDLDSPLEWVSKDTIYREADVISIHVPLTKQTRYMIGRTELMAMKPDAVLINTARGGIVNEVDLLDVLRAGYLGGVAVDVFEQEPYQGPLAEIERCLLTSHMGSMSVDCRTKMEIEATEEAMRFFEGRPLEGEVPQVEYDVQIEAR